MLLEAKNIKVYYGKHLAVNDVSMSVPEGAIVSIIGANEAGKSTFLKALTGLVPLSEGEIYFQGQKISGKPTNEIVKRGIALVPEGRQLFPYLSVFKNLMLGASLRKDRGEINATLEEVYQLFPRLKERSNQNAGTLSGGEQQMLAIGRGFMAKPKLLCMDEPSLGLAPIVVDRIGEVVRDINKRGVSVLLVEQNARLALGVASLIYVLQLGELVVEGDVDSIKNTDIVKKAYLGG
jgi:branched-chain amino acid transport system ATP-binding protein